MQKTILDLWQLRQTSVMFITHDLTEAITLSDRVAVMTGRPGRSGGRWTFPSNAPGMSSHHRPGDLPGTAARLWNCSRPSWSPEERMDTMSTGTGADVGGQQQLTMRREGRSGRSPRGGGAGAVPC